ncbi:MAG: PilN domain-containing protein [Chthoniobacterales bacterium]
MERIKMFSRLSNSLKPIAATDMRNGISRVVIPGAGADSQEVWIQENSTLHRSDSTDIPRAEFSRTVFCWSCRDTFTLPVWVAEEGDAENMVALELEMRGVIRPGQTPGLIIDKILTENERRLYAVHFLKKEDVPCPLPEVKCHDISTRWLGLESDSLHFWKENDSVVYALTRGNQVVYAESLLVPELTTSELQRVQRVIERLQSEDVLSTSLSSIVYVDPLLLQKNKFLDRLFKNPAKQQKSQVLNIPENFYDLPSRDILDRRRKQHTIANLKRIVSYSLVGLFLFLLLSSFQFIREILEIRKLENNIALQTPEIDRLSTIAQQWKIVEAALDPDFYPADILRDCAAQLPAAGTRFTAFTVNGSEITIQGEAASHPAAFDFIENIKKSPVLFQYNWEASQPSLLPNNTASFILRGTRKTYAKLKS